MDTKEFAYWLQGFVEMSDGKMPTEPQWKMIVDHLNTIFVKVTPPLKDEPKPSQTVMDSFDNFLKFHKIKTTKPEQPLSRIFKENEFPPITIC